MVNTERLAQEQALRAARKQRGKLEEILQAFSTLEARVVFLEEKLGIIQKEEEEITEASIEIQNDLDAPSESITIDLDALEHISL